VGVTKTLKKFLDGVRSIDEVDSVSIEAHSTKLERTGQCQFMIPREREKNELVRWGSDQIEVDMAC